MITNLHELLASALATASFDYIIFSDMVSSPLSEWLSSLHAVRVLHTVLYCRQFLHKCFGYGPLYPLSKRLSEVFASWIFVFNIPITIRKHFENTGPVDCIQQRPKGIFEIYIYTGGI